MECKKDIGTQLNHCLTESKTNTRKQSLSQEDDLKTEQREIITTKTIMKENRMKIFEDTSDGNKGEEGVKGVINVVNKW